MCTIQCIFSPFEKVITPNPRRATTAWPEGVFEKVSVVQGALHVLLVSFERISGVMVYVYALFYHHAIQN
jgi:hypothetical protein